MDKKIIIGAIVAVIIIVLAVFMLMPNEDAIYNEKMSIVYDDITQLEAFLNESNSTQAVSNNAQMELFLTQADNITAVADKDITELTELNKSITNTTRKEYIGLCIQDLELAKQAVVLIKDGINTVKDMNDNKITPAQALEKINTMEKDLNKSISDASGIENQMRDYEAKYPFVLINGTISIVGNNTTQVSNNTTA